MTVIYCWILMGLIVYGFGLFKMHKHLKNDINNNSIPAVVGIAAVLCFLCMVIWPIVVMSSISYLLTKKDSDL